MPARESSLGSAKQALNCELRDDCFIQASNRAERSPDGILDLSVWNA
jgi:hypothetical protein